MQTVRPIVRISLIAGVALLVGAMVDPSMASSLGSRPRGSTSDALSVTLNTGSGLNGVAIHTDQDAWDVGYVVDPDGKIRTRTLHWNGSAWSHIPSPNMPTNVDVLNAVSVRSDSDAWAVGYYGGSSSARTLILHWNGVSWSHVSSPQPGAFYRYLYAVDIVSKNDVWAVGQYYTATSGFEKHTMTLHWNGAKWSWIPSPDPGSGYNALYGVSGSSSDDVWAAGGDGANNLDNGPAEPLLLHWTGSKWTKTSPLPGSQIGLNAVSADSAGDAWAVGNYGYGYNADVFLHWDGASWTQVTAPSAGFQHNTLASVGAISDSEAWAAGTSDGVTALFHWDGLAWTRIAGVDPSNYSVVNGVATGSSASARAVGFWIDADTSHQHPLQLVWNGANWSEG